KDVQAGAPPVPRHLTAPGAGIVFCSHRGEERVERRDPQRKTQRAVTVVGINPIMAGPENESRRGLHAFVPRPANLEKRLVLALELDFAVVQTPREVHDAVNSKKIFPSQALILAGVKFRTLGACFDRHAISPRTAL